MMADWIPVNERGGAQGLLWMSSRLGGAAAPSLLVWLFAVMGDWKIPLVLTACLGVVWALAFWPWFRNRPEDMPQVNQEERAIITSGRAIRSASRPRQRSLDGDDRVAQRAGPLCDVWIPRLQRQLLFDPAADLSQEPPAHRFADRRVPDLAAVCLRRDGVSGRRGAFRSVHPPLGSALGPAVDRGFRPCPRCRGNSRHDLGDRRVDAGPSCSA